MGNADLHRRNIQMIFGHEAAEDESPKRLSEYYFKNQTYEKVKANLPLRILVGHKGIGKSDLFAVARWEDDANKILSILLRPDDVTEIVEDASDFNKQIKSWKIGLLRVVEKKIAEISD